MTAPASAVGSDWQRPHPLSVAVLIASFVANNAWTIAVAVVGGSVLDLDSILLVGGAVTVLFGVLGWYMTGFAVTDDAVEYRSGVLHRRARSIPLDRIQQVSVAEPVLARIAGLAVVQVAEASADGDVEIRYLKLAAANELTGRLRDLVRAREATAMPDSDQVAGDGDPLPQPERPAVVLHRTRIGELVRFQLAMKAPVHGAISVVLAAVAIALALGTSLVGDIALFSVSASILAAMALLDMGGVVLTFGNLTLRRGARALRIDTGLLSRRRIEVRPDRIQIVTVGSGPLARRFGLHEVKFSAATGKAGRSQRQLVHLAPAIRTDRIVGLIQGSVDVDAGFDVELEPVSELTVRRQLVRAGMAYAFVVVPASVGLFVLHPVGVVFPTLVWWPAVIWYARARHRRLGLSVDQRRLIVRRGVVNHELTQLPLTNVQSVTTHASFFQRRLGLADLIVATAGIGAAHHVRVPDLPHGRADELRIALAEAAAATMWELRG